MRRELSDFELPVLFILHDCLNSEWYKDWSMEMSERAGLDGRDKLDYFVSCHKWYVEGNDVYDEDMNDCLLFSLTEADRKYLRLDEEDD